MDVPASLPIGTIQDSPFRTGIRDPRGIDAGLSKETPTMKYVIPCLALLFLTAASTGCHHNLATNGCGCSSGCASGCAGGGCAGGCGSGSADCLAGNCGCGKQKIKALAGELGWRGCKKCGAGKKGSGKAAQALANHRYNHIPYLPLGYYRQQGPPGPPTGTVAYPYYTNRAPRDFLVDNPPGIGR